MDFQLPQGFRFAGVSCGIKASQTNDIALIVSDQPCVITGVYTQNVVRASSIEWNEKITPCSNGKAVLVNSGNANACTGLEGKANNRRMAELAVDSVNGLTNPEQVVVLSTGVIGVQLPMEKIKQGIDAAAQQLGDSQEDFLQAIDGIRTTDKDRKFKTTCFESNGQTFRIAAMAKGAGMIGPRMATMLAVIATDFPMTTETADQILKRSVDASFNRISVEGHTSTNDAVILLCPPAEIDELHNDAAEHVIHETCVELAKMIPADGEGATHLVEIKVEGADDDVLADRVARVIAGSNLVKTAITGADPNWGRIVSAIGILDIKVDPEGIGLRINGQRVFAEGQPLDFDAREVSDSINSQFETKLEITLGHGQGKSLHWTSDLTVDYVRFNSEYTT